MQDIDYDVYDRLEQPEQVDYLVAWDISRYNAETFVYSLDRPFVFKKSHTTNEAA